MPPRVSQDHLERRRREILEAAFHSFASKGLRGTTMQEIAAKAGMSAGALYRYFDSKQALIEALAGAAAGRREEALKALRPGAGAAALAELVAEMIGALGSAEAGSAARLDVRLWAEALDHSEVREVVAKAFESLQGPIADYLRTERAAGRLREGVAADCVGRIVVALITGLELQRAYDPSLDLEGCGAAVGEMLSRLG